MLLYFSETVFLDEGEVLNGSAWVPLRPTTVNEKDDAGYGNKGILERTGTLKGSFYDEVTPNSLFLSNKARTPDDKFSLFEIHQLGTGDKGSAIVPPDHPGRGKNIPPRPMLGINKPLESLIQAVIKADVDAKIAEALAD